MTGLVGSGGTASHRPAMRPDAGSRARFLDDVTRHPANAALLSRWHRLDLPNAWLVAGCLFQTVWNLRTGRDPGEGVQDHDLFYFDAGDLGAEAERHVQARVDDLCGDLGVTIEVANQARVHLWYEAHFGHPYPALRSSEDGIARFLVRETCVGVRPGAVCAPHGTAGVYAGTLSPNPLTPHRRLFDRKVASYRARWPWLVVQARAA